MAIKVGGTTVVSDARQLSNIATVDSTTATAISNAGVGGGGEHEFTASGALANGDTVVINSDGTVSVVAETSYSEGAGTPTVFESAAAYTPTIAYDSNAQKVVVAYSDGGNSFYGTAVVGTVSGTSITFGTPVVFYSGRANDIDATYDENAQKIVIAYQDQPASRFGKAIVGTVSGTSISFGSAATFESSRADNISITYDKNAQKVVIAYETTDSSSFGYGIVGTVSGTSISFGSATNFGQTNQTAIAYDENAGKVLIAYRDDAIGSKGSAIVGTVSGTGISFGSFTQFEAGQTAGLSVAYDSNAQKCVIAYSDGGDSFYGKARVATISGTSVSFPSGPTTFDTDGIGSSGAVYDPVAQKVVITANGKAYPGTISGTTITFATATTFESGGIDESDSVYDSNTKTVVTAYNDTGNSYYGTAAVFRNAGSNTNLTSENFIGFSNGAYSDTNTATIQVVSAVDDAQTGLTAGEKYYVQTDGTLSLTPDDPSVYAGVALSATKILIKG